MLEIELGDDVEWPIVQGATFHRVVRIKQSGIRVPLTGYAGRGQVRHRKSQESPKLLDFEVTVSQVDALNDEDCGRIDVRADDDATGAVKRDGYFSIELYQPGEVIRVLQGPAPLDKETTV